MLPFKVTSISVGKKIFVWCIKGVSSNRFKTLLYWQKWLQDIVFLCGYAYSTFRNKASIETHPPPKRMICIRTFSNYLPTSNIWYHTWRSIRQYVWFIFWRLGVQTSSSRQTIMAQGNKSVAAGLDVVLPRRSNNTETALFNKRLNVCYSYSLVACDPAYWVEQTNISVTEIYGVSIFRVECYIKK